jgi:hypothetical protein
MAAAGCGETADQGDADQAVHRWAQEHAGGWTITADDASHAFVRAPFSETCVNNTITLRYVAPGYQVDLGVACPGPQGTDLAGLRSGLEYVVLDELPHGLDVPGWRFRIFTPTSSFTEGVELVSWDGGRLKVKIDTGLFALDGDRDGKECETPADGATPAACRVRAELRNLPLHLTVTAPLAAATLMVR